MDLLTLLTIFNFTENRNLGYSTEEIIGTYIILFIIFILLILIGGRFSLIFKQFFNNLGVNRSESNMLVITINLLIAIFIPLYSSTYILSHYKNIFPLFFN